MLNNFLVKRLAGDDDETSRIAGCSELNTVLAVLRGKNSRVERLGGGMRATVSHFPLENVGLGRKGISIRMRQRAEEAILTKAFQPLGIACQNLAPFFLRLTSKYQQPPRGLTGLETKPSSALPSAVPQITFTCTSSEGCTEGISDALRS